MANLLIINSQVLTNCLVQQFLIWKTSNPLRDFLNWELLCLVNSAGKYKMNNHYAKRVQIDIENNNEIILASNDPLEYLYA